MLCSMCKKNTAVIFINKQSADGKAEVEGLCYECAKKKGINPIDTMAKQANLSDKDIQDLSNKLDTMFKNLSENISDIDADELAVLAAFFTAFADNLAIIAAKKSLEGK